MVVKSEIYKFPDTFGNELILRMLFNEYLKPTSATVYLRLQNMGNYPRQIGYIDIPKRTFHCYRDSTKHLHIKSNSYGFNYFLTEERFGIDKINVKIDRSAYTIGIDVLREQSVVFNFKAQGFEVQRFLPVDVILKHGVGRKRRIKAGDKIN
jgi:hypothetical protein